MQHLEGRVFMFHQDFFAQLAGAAWPYYMCSGYT